MLLRGGLRAIALASILPSVASLRASAGVRATALASLRGGRSAMSGAQAATAAPAAAYDWTKHFELVTSELVLERQLTCSVYRHIATGAEVLSVDADDDNKVFSCNFRTLPKDDTGVPHILEHSVLCGSRKYPLKEPFVELLKGSLKTFLNAMTAADRTMYPVASCNKQDFLNLADVCGQARGGQNARQRVGGSTSEGGELGAGAAKGVPPLAVALPSSRLLSNTHCPSSCPPAPLVSPGRAAQLTLSSAASLVAWQVYLDACFHPLMRDPVRGPQILKQEGWHFEVDDPSAPQPLSYKGVVFNEMKVS